MDIYDHIKKAIKNQGRKQSHLAAKLHLSRGKLTPFLKRQGSLYSNELIDLLLELGFKITDPDGNEITENKTDDEQAITGLDEPNAMQDNTIHQTNSNA